MQRIFRYLLLIGVLIISGCKTTELSGLAGTALSLNQSSISEDGTLIFNKSLLAGDNPAVGPLVVKYNTYMSKINKGEPVDYDSLFALKQETEPYGFGFEPDRLVHIMLQQMHTNLLPKLHDYSGPHKLDHSLS